MNMTNIRDKAKSMGIVPGKMKKADLIREIQRTEGNMPCFGKPKDNSCSYTNCCFRKDCLR